MIVKIKNDWKIWRGCRPFSATCGHDENCECLYHVVRDGTAKSYGFKTWQEAENDFCKRSGAEKYVPGKTKWNA